MSEHHELQAAFDELEALAARPAAEFKALGTTEVCEIYCRTVRPLIERILPILKIVAPKLAAAIEVLKGLLDKLCNCGG